jgi:hypothetical protein
MIKLKVSVTNQPIKNGRSTTITSSWKELPVTHIKRASFHSYRAKVYDPEKNAPHDLKAHMGECWLWFRKKDNTHVKLPVLKEDEIAEI